MLPDSQAVAFHSRGWLSQSSGHFFPPSSVSLQVQGAIDTMLSSLGGPRALGQECWRCATPATLAGVSSDGGGTGVPCRWTPSPGPGEMHWVPGKVPKRYLPGYGGPRLQPDLSPPNPSSFSDIVGPPGASSWHGQNSSMSAATGMSPFDASLGCQPQLLFITEGELADPSIQQHISHCRRAWRSTDHTPAPVYRVGQKGVALLQVHSPENFI